MSTRISCVITCHPAVIKFPVTLTLFSTIVLLASVLLRSEDSRPWTLNKSDAEMLICMRVHVPIQSMISSKSARSVAQSHVLHLGWERIPALRLFSRFSIPLRWVRGFSGSNRLASLTACVPTHHFFCRPGTYVQGINPERRNAVRFNMVMFAESYSVGEPAMTTYIWKT
ncbi:hypothetical protein F4802DRAFT_497398 [Xylaria palmicola]|nr:hypothetical protein F4802DRAFT_497398 [Xylaria palmicola]